MDFLVDDMPCRACDGCGLILNTEAGGDNPQLRIALCGYEGEHAMPDSWECVGWRQRKGYQTVKQGVHSGHKERIWFSPHCLKVGLFENYLQQNQQLEHADSSGDRQ